MDFVKNLANQASGSNQNSNQGQGFNQNAGSSNSGQQNQSSGGGGFLSGLGGQQNQSSGSGSGGGFLSGLGDKLNGAAGGGRESEKNEDMLDKGIDFVQEKFLGQGPQDNESAVEQAKDEQISDAIRRQYKQATGSDLPIKDKETRFG